jgi:hypothetical protein
LVELLTKDDVGAASLILTRSICALAQFAYFGVEPKTDETEDAPVGSSTCK